MVLYGLGQLLPGVESVLAMKATNTYGSHSYVWNLFTAGFFNTNIFMVGGPFKRVLVSVSR